jgi:hypothetical protein
MVLVEIIQLAASVTTSHSVRERFKFLSHSYPTFFFPSPIGNVMATADIAIAVNITGRDSSVFPATGRIWVSYGRHNPNTRLYDHGIHFTFGYQAFGSVVEVIERRVISNPFLNTLGFVPVRLLVCSLFVTNRLTRRTIVTL